MQIYIGSAKTMDSQAPWLSGCSHPRFGREARRIAAELSGYTAEELSGMLRCNSALAGQARARLLHFNNPNASRPAIMAYDGIVYKCLDARSLSIDDLEYAQGHLIIGSFLYGMLRPLDLINPYRLEGNVTLPGNGYQTMWEHWRSMLTDALIQQVKDDDGVLINLASAEMCDLFDWKKVCRELQVITPCFKVERDGRLRTIVVYAKMCRGAMTRYIITHRLDDTSGLRDFEYEGFRWEDDWNFNLR